MCDTLCVLLSSAIQSGDLHVSLRFPGFYCRVRARAIEQSGCMCKHLIAVVAPFHNTVNTQGGVRSPTENWIEIRWGEAERWSRRGEKGSQDSLGRHQLQIRYKYKYTNTQIHKYSIWRSARKTQHVAYFWKEDCSRVSKIIFPYNTNLNIWVSHSCTRSSLMYLLLISYVLSYVEDNYIFFLQWR